MLVEEFAKKHDLCPAGHEMMAPFLKKTVREWWEDASQANRGTWVFWLASRAQLDPKTIVRCVVKSARDLAPLLPDPAAGNAILDQVEAWCDGRKSRDEARAAAKSALAHAEAARGNDKLFHAWSGIYYISRCIESTTNSPGASSAIAKAVALAGKETAAEAEARYAAIVRSAFTWSDVEHAISLNKPSPLARPSTVEEVAEKTQQRLAEYKDALVGAESACATLEDYCKQQQFSLDGVSRLLGSEGGEVVRSMVEAAVSSMEAADNRAAAGPQPEKSKTPKRGRMMV
jgi:hypothetical protein